MRRRKTPAPKELQVGGSKPSGGSYSQIVGVRANDKFVNCRSGDRSPLAAPHLLEVAAPAPPFDPSVSFHFLASPEPIDPTGQDEEHRIEHVRPEAEDGVDESEQDGRRGEARSHEHPAAGQPDETVVEACFHEVMMEGGVP